MITKLFVLSAQIIHFTTRCLAVRPPKFVSPYLVLGTLVALLGLALTSHAQPNAGPDLPIDAKTRKEIIHSLLAQLNAQYVFPTTAAQIQHTIQRQLAAGAYAHLTSSQEFARTLTTQLRQLSHDNHLGVSYQNTPAGAASGDATPTPEKEARRQRFATSINFGFEKVERLTGNVGYLRLDGFMPASLAAETATAAMTYLAHTDALIVDLRYNRGGDPSMVSFLASYFFGPDSVHLNDLYWREGNRTQQFWTVAHLPGRRYTDRPVYLLTSGHTFSAGEEFAYDLQSLKRAVVIGEATGGGANPGGDVRLGEHFAAFIPTGRAINPVTKTNWEGTGVKPNIDAPEAQALRVAHLAALNNLLSSARDEQAKNELTKAVAQVTDEK